jgi:hypothetical protein
MMGEDGLYREDNIEESHRGENREDADRGVNREDDTPLRVPPNPWTERSKLFLLLLCYHLRVFKELEDGVYREDKIEE